MEMALGSTLDQLHKPKEAAQAYQRAIDDDSDNLDARRGLAAALLTDGQLDAAQDQLKQIIVAGITTDVCKCSPSPCYLAKRF